MTATLVCMVLTSVGAEPIESLYARLVPELQVRLGPVEKLTPGGHELAVALLQPLTERGPLSADAIADRTTKEAIGKNRWAADQVLAHQVSLLGGYERQELGDPIDWFRAPKDDWQWPTHLSRHYWLEPAAWQYRGTGEAQYGDEVVKVLLDWVARTPIHSPDLKWGRDVEVDGHVISEGPFKGYGDGPWTSLSAHARTDTWTGLFALVWDTPAMTNAAVATLLNSLFGDHLRSMVSFPRSMNQSLSIANTLIHLGMWYPWFDGAAEAEQIGWQRLTHYATHDIYPDGSMAECSPNYAIGSLKKINGNVGLAAKHDRPVPDELREQIRLGARYFAEISDPHGRAPRIAKGRESVRGDINWLNQAFADPEVAFVASAGKEGTPPPLQALFAWAGHAVMRSGWDEGATWLFMELGPRGSGHHDYAQNGIQLQAAGDWLLTDPGFYTYSNAGEEGAMYNYLHSSFAHNTATVDDQGQIRGQAGVNQAAGEYLWEVTPETVTTEGVYRFGYGHEGGLKVIHRRRLTYHRNEDRIVVQDSFEGEGRHIAQIHWQIPPGNRVDVANNVIRAAGSRAALRLEPSAAVPLTIAVVEGQHDPLAGWFSESYGKLTPAPRVTVAASGELPLSITTTLQIERPDAVR